MESPLESCKTGEVKKLGFAPWRYAEECVLLKCLGVLFPYKDFLTIQGLSCDEMLGLFFVFVRFLLQTPSISRVMFTNCGELKMSCYIPVTNLTRYQNPNHSVPRSFLCRNP